jgi:NAD(P)-dependent dehydrogenase (short-subunit alcohol dehydrogenase family)
LDYGIYNRDEMGLVHCRHLAKSGAHVVLAVRNVKAAKNLLEEWQSGQEDGSSPLNVEVIPLPSSILRLVGTCLHSLQITWMILFHLKKCATKAHNTQ